jgi:hypothetical protein
VVASLREALRHPAMGRYGLAGVSPVRVLIQGFGDVGGSVARLLTEEAPPGAFPIVGVSDEFGGLYRAEGLDVLALLKLRAGRRPVGEYAGPADARWAGAEALALMVQDADVFVPAAIPNVIDSGVAARLRVRLVAEGANNAVAPKVEEDLHARGVLYLPGQALNWGGVKGSTLEALFRERTKRRVPWAEVEGRIRPALAPLAGAVDVAWALEALGSALPGAPLDPEETRAFAVAILEDLARNNTRWLMNELADSGHARPPLDLVKSLSRGVRSLKVQLLSLVEKGLGAEFFERGTSLQRLRSLLDNRLRDLLSETDALPEGLTTTQVAEQRQMLQQLQSDVPTGLSPVLAALLAALDLARQKVMDPDSYSPESLGRDLEVLRDPGAAPEALEDSLYRLQRVHPGAGRAAFSRALAGLVVRHQSVVVRRNAALALARLGSADPGDRAVLFEGLADGDLSVRAACRWALHQMAIPTPGML